MTGFKSIVCAVDFSSGSRRALEEAADLARRTAEHVVRHARVPVLVVPAR